MQTRERQTDTVCRRQKGRATEIKKRETETERHTHRQTAAAARGPSESRSPRPRRAEGLGVSSPLARPTRPGSRSWLPGGGNSPGYSLGEGTALTPLGPRVPKASSSPSTGWWFDACGLSNLNGVYYPARHHARKLNGIRWHYFQGPSYSLRATRMMLRPAAV